MDIKVLLEKFQGILSEEDINGLVESIDTLITEAAEKQVEAEIEDLVEASISKINSIKEFLTEQHSDEAAEYIKSLRESDAKEAASYIQSLTEAHAFEVAEFVKNREAELTESLEEKLVAHLDSTIDAVIAENFSEDLIEKIALNETYRPIVEGMQNLLSSRLLLKDSEGFETLKESEEKILKQDSEIKKLNEKINRVTSLLESTKLDVETIRAEKIILEKCEGLSDSQKKTVKLLAESTDISILPSKIDAILESVLSSENEDIINEEEETLTESASSSARIVRDEINEMVTPSKKALTESAAHRANEINTFKRLSGYRL